MNSILTAHDACNPLISKDDIGKSRRMSDRSYYWYIELDTYYTLPNKDFSYGRPNIKDPLNARILTSSWSEHVASKEKIDSNCVNFVGINRAGPIRGSISAKAVAVMVARLKEVRRLEKVPKSAEPVLPLIASGKASPSPIPISDVIENKFGNEGELASANRYHQYLSKRIAQSKIKVTIKPTKASSGHHVHLKTELDREPFKLSKFKNIPSRY